jgi:hypothetical protein
MAKPELSLAEAEYARRALLASSLYAHNTAPRKELGGMSPYEAVYAAPIPFHPMRIYQDCFYPPNVPRSSPQAWKAVPLDRGLRVAKASPTVLDPPPYEELPRQDSTRTKHLQCYMLHRAGEEAVRPSLVHPAISSSSGLVPRAQWMIEAEPELSDKDADANWIAARSSFVPSKRIPSPPSPSSFTGENTLKVTAELMHPDKAKRTIINLAIDRHTLSDVTTALREYLTDVHAIIPDRVAGLGGETDFHEEGTLHVWSRSKRQKISMPALVAPRHQLPLDCVALLSVPAILQLEVAVEKHLRMPQFAMLQCHLGEKRLREWLELHPDSAPDTRPFDIEAISPEHISERSLSMSKGLVSCSCL